MPRNTFLRMNAQLESTTMGMPSSGTYFWACSVKKHASAQFKVIDKEENMAGTPLGMLRLAYKR